MRLAIVLPALFLAGAAATPAAADITGRWLTEGGKATVEIAPCGAKVCGTIVDLKEPMTPEGKAKTDWYNKDESLKLRPIIGLPMLEGFTKVGETKWDKGTIYNPEDGDTYEAILTLDGENALVVEGCIRVLFRICKSQDWTRAPN